jgi:hypothetical protein
MANITLPRGIVLTDEERIKLGSIIRNYIYSVYRAKVGGPIMAIDGKKIDPDILTKIPNNRTMLAKLCFDERNEIVTGIRNKEDLFRFVSDNLFDLFNHKGKYFNVVYSLVTATSYKGDTSEQKSFSYFEKVAASRGLQVKVTKPTKLEDIGGIDGQFFHQGKRFTIQVKPLHKMESYKKDPNMYIVFCDGMLKTINCDYLIVTNDLDIFIFRNPKIDKEGHRDIISYGSYFLVHKEKLLTEKVN